MQMKFAQCVYKGCIFLLRCCEASQNLGAFGLAHKVEHAVVVLEDGPVGVVFADGRFDEEPWQTPVLRHQWRFK